MASFMKSTKFVTFIIFSVLLCYDVVQIQASHHVSMHLQTSALSQSPRPLYQPYRTAYHFQPVKNWINGKFIFNFIHIYFLCFKLSGLTTNKKSRRYYFLLKL